ncbi:hypothetical protein [Streptomyces chartreusis]|uniref:hypothetical protein n=1 Tax=Streptomyces chartreusis TaxID=1969 RepID=UPI0033DC5923
MSSESRRPGEGRTPHAAHRRLPDLDSAVAALNESRTLRFELTAPDDAENGFALVNFAHVAAVKVWPGAGKGADDEQYL